MMLLQGFARLIGALEKVMAHSTLAYLQSLDAQVKLHQLADPKSVIHSVLMVGGGFLLLALIALLVNLAVLVMFTPLVAVHVRRLHDTSRTGW
jgi:uncharacterized membrane protein YhaH (DUF805 family)